MKIEVVKITLFDSSKPLKGFAEVIVDNWKIPEWRILRYGNRSPIVKCPQLFRKDPETHEITIKNLIQMPDEELKPIADAILEAYRLELLKFQDNVAADEPQTTVTFKRTEEFKQNG